MDLAISINFAYLALLLGALMTLFALLTPGTGIFEVGALAGLLVASLAVFSLTINVWALVVLVLGVIPFMLAIYHRGQRIYLLISIIAIVVGSAYLFQGPTYLFLGVEWWLPGVNPLLAAIGSASAGSLLWLMTVKVLEAKAETPLHDMSDIIGAKGETRTKVHHDGSVYVYGEMWTARSDKPIKTGTIVRVLGREGLILQVESLKED